METTTGKLVYHSYQETNKEDILRLWKEESEWGGLTLQQFDSWFVHTPYGKCIIVVAADGAGKVAGQIIFSPSKMIVDGVEINALRASAPILSSTLRQSSLRTLEHPAFGLIKTGFQVAQDAGYQYVYTFPSYGWLGMLQLFPRVMPNPCETASYDCFAVSLENAQTFITLSKEYKVSVASTFTEEYDRLWEDAVQQMPVNCGIVRKAKWLKWVIGGQLKLEVRDNGNRLMGYMAIKKETGLITDVFARNPDDLKAVFQHCVNALHQQNKGKIPVSFVQLKAMLTPHTEPLVASLNYAKDSYRFAFGSYLLDTAIPFEKTQTARWYMTPLG